MVLTCPCYLFLVRCGPRQVTNPPLDPLREKVVTSTRCMIGPEGDITDVGLPEQAHRCAPSASMVAVSSLAGRLCPGGYSVSLLPVQSSRVCMVLLCQPYAMRLMPHGLL